MTSDMSILIGDTTKTSDIPEVSALLTHLQKKHAEKPGPEEINAKMTEAQEMADKAYQMRREISELKATLATMEKTEKELRFESRNLWQEFKGQLPGNTRLLLTNAIELSRGEWGPSKYSKSIELFEKLLLVEEYRDNAAFYLAAMYLKGKVDDLRKDRTDRNQNLSDVRTADLYASMITNASLKNAWIQKRRKYLRL